MNRGYWNGTCIGLTVLLLAVLCSCSSEITGKPVGRLTVEEATRLYMNHPTVVEWLRATDAQAVYFPSEDHWKIELKDGWIIYTEAKGKNGLLYVNQIAPASKDPAVVKRLQNLREECEKAVANQRE